MPDTAELELTILMPCLDEAETLAICIARARGFLERSEVTGEVLVADNGSTDGSQDLARASGARVVDVPRRGYGAALIGGIEAARGRFVIMGDADDSYDFEALAPFVSALRGGDDLVVGNRFRGGIAKGAMPVLHRYLGNPVLSFLGRIFYRIPLGDFHCGLRGFSRDAVRGLGLRAPGMEFASEMIVKASLAGLRIAEVPTTLRPDGRSRPPHLKTWTDGWRHLRFLLLHSPRWLFYYPGICLIAIGAVLAGRLAVGDVEIAEGVEIGVHTLLAACFTVVIGVQLVMFAVLAKAHSVAAGILPASGHDLWLARVMTVERVLIAALVLLLLGLGGIAWAVAYWASLGFGGIFYRGVLTVVAVSLSLVTISLQAAFTGLLAAAFRLSDQARGP